MSQPGYYPGFSTLSQSAFWDQATRDLVLDRVENTPPLRFFSPAEAATLDAVFARLVPQDDRTPERRIPILPVVDAKLHHGIGDGYRFEDMPPDGEAMKLGSRAIDEMARHVHGRGFVEVSAPDQERLLRSIHDGDPVGSSDVWDRMPPERFWQLLVQFAAEAYYSHPWAWDEIGFGGPAYPRGYFRLDGGRAEPWEVAESRYDWEPPPGSVSGEYAPIGGEKQDHPPPSQEGSH